MGINLFLLCEQVNLGFLKDIFLFQSQPYVDTQVSGRIRFDWLHTQKEKAEKEGVVNLSKLLYRYGFWGYGF